ncbi:MAG: sulfatase [Acidobacteriia bacterium]|nr:sulfatase [Terriglobia bacterium]
MESSLRTTGQDTVQKPGTWRDLAIAGATHALRVWVVYWLVESFFWTLWPWFTVPGYEYKPTHPWLPPLALGVYMFVGATLGGAMAICLGRVVRGSAHRAVPLVGPLSLAVTSGILALVNAQYVQLFIAFLLTTIIATSFRTTAWVEMLRPVLNFWSTPLGLLAYPVALTEFESPATGRFVGISAVIAVFLAPYVAARLLKNTVARDEAKAPGSARSIAVWVGLMAMSIGLSLALKQQPILASPPRTAVAPAKNGSPNVILITLDTVRADHLSVYGYQRDTTPTLGKFVQDATIFTHAVSAGDMTLSSHASMFTGLYPSQHGAHWVLGRGKEGFSIGTEFGLRLPENSQTLAGILSARGYRTIGIVANTTYLQDAFRLDQGFQYYSQPNAVLLLEQRELFYLRTNLCRLIGHFCPRSMSDLVYTRAADINREAFQLLEGENTRKRPFFLLLNYMEAHPPYFPPAPYDSRYPGKDPLLKGPQYWAIEFQALSLVRPYTARDRQRDESQYDGGIAYMDARLSDLFAKLKDLGLYDDSVIILTSDHGQSFGEKQLVGHGTSVYQEQVRVPLIIKYPGPPQAAVRDDLVSHVDLLPTILDLLGDKIPPSLPGHSLRAPAPSPGTVISESFPCDMTASLHPRFRRVERAAFSGPFKLILATNGKREFYDLSADPHEEHNLYLQNPPAASRMESELRHWISTLPGEHARPAVLDRNAVDRLKSLGYVQ